MASLFDLKPHPQPFPKIGKGVSASEKRKICYLKDLLSDFSGCQVPRLGDLGGKQICITNSFRIEPNKTINPQIPHSKRHCERPQEAWCSLSIVEGQSHINNRLLHYVRNDGLTNSPTSRGRQYNS